MSPFFLCAFWSVAAIQSPAIQSPVEFYSVSLEAAKDYANKDWAKSADEYARLLAYSPDSGSKWANLGQALYQLKRYKASGEAYAHAHFLAKSNPGAMAYNAACSFALEGDTESAFKWLKVCMDSRFEQRPSVQEDSDFASLHSDPRWPEFSSGSPSPALSRNEGWRFDLNFLVKEIKRMHAVYSHEPLPDGVTEKIKSLDREIPKISDYQIFLRIQEIIAGLGDGHSVLYPVSNRIPSTVFPFSLYIFPEGVYVADSDKYPQLVGKRVAKLGDRSMDELMGDLHRYVSKDNEMNLLWIGPVYLSVPAFLVAMNASSSIDSVAVSTDTGEAVTVKAEALTRIPHNKLGPLGTNPPLWLSRPNETFWFQKADAPDTLYCQFNQVQDDSATSLTQYAQNLRKELEAGHYKNLIVDVRRNNGGNSTLLKELVRTLVVFDATPGCKLYVMIGRDTFSAAQVFVNRIEVETNAIFVGEPTGSRPYFIGEDTNLVLPWSGARGSISSQFHSAAGSDTRPWIAPQIPVTLTAKDYFAGRDPALEAIFEVIRKG